MADETPDPAFRYEVSGADAAGVRRIVEATDFFTPAEVDVAVELVEERLARGDASGYHFVLADEDGRTVGYACYGPIACTVGSYDLFWIAVDPAVQGRGCGRRLLVEAEWLIARAGGRHIYIETSNRPQYVPTRGFYTACGYELAAVLPDFYNTGDDKVIYRKRLDVQPQPGE
ncbi:MAG: GNAT family N-acetyltransferase [Planctomycetes bacterium]|nr:GNAT family N-acetyltransferase [Planctomycetota bacterium]